MLWCDGFEEGNWIRKEVQQLFEQDDIQQRTYVRYYTLDIKAIDKPHLMTVKTSYLWRSVKE